jgi:glycosyltransferase involved in cell wall biosynthesis
MTNEPATSRSVILQVLPALGTGGVERGTIEIAEAIAGCGGVALVASAGGPQEPLIRRAGGRHVTLPLDTKNPWAIWRNAAKLAALIRAEGVSIVHARSRGPAWSAKLACRRTGVHFMTTHHGTYSENLPFKRRYNAVMASGERVIAASRFIADLIEQRYGTDSRHIRVIPRGVDTAIFDPDVVSPSRIARLAKSWRLPDGIPTVLLPGRLREWKGQTVLLDAIARMDRKDVCCVLVGGGDARITARLIRQAGRLGISDRLRMVGNSDDMPAALMLADVVIHASTAPEAFGRVVIEAQAMGRLVIASDLGGPVETVEDGVTGWRVPPGDADALAITIDHALSLSEADRRDMEAAARASVLRNYTKQAMQEATLDVYEELLAGGEVLASGEVLAGTT